MPVALKSKEVSSHSPTSAVFRSRKHRLKGLFTTSQHEATVPLDLPVKRQYPLWLRVMMTGQWISFGVAAVAIAGSLITYALTVNTHRRLGVATTTLERLQVQQQQLTAANAVVKNHLADIALNTLQDSVLHPKNVIFLETVEAPATTPVTEPGNAPLSPVQERVFPQGY